MDEPSSFGQLLRARRAALDLTRAELAERVGCSVELIRRIETGQRRPSKQVALRLATCLELPEAERAGFVWAARGVTPPAAPLRQAPPADAPCPRHNLPAPLTPLVGREHELADLHALLARDDVRLLTLTGPGGTGKTRLALAAAAEQLPSWPDGIWFVDLAPLRAPDQVAPAIAAALGVAERRDQPLALTLAAFLRAKRLLLVLDNFEHLLDAAPLAADLLRAAPSLAVAATSRVRLRLSGEQLYPVPPLEIPDLNVLPPLEALAPVASVRLFVARAQAVLPGFVLTEENAPQIAAICVRLGGLPLAIELAAPRLTLFTPVALLARLEHALPLLVDGPRDVPQRQHTLAATIVWSVELLGPNAQTLLARLGVFVGGWSLETAEAVCGGEATAPLDVVAGMAELLEHQLVRRVADVAGEARFTMLELVREFAEARLGERGERAVLEARRAAAMLALAERAAPELDRDDPAPWLARLDADLANLRATLAWCQEPSGDANIGVQLAIKLSWYWREKGLLREVLDWAERILAHPAVQAPTVLRARALRLAGNLISYRIEDHARAIVLLNESVELAYALGDAPALAAALKQRGWTLTMTGDGAAAERAFQEALALFRELGDASEAAWMVSFLGRARETQGDRVAARAHYAEAGALFRALGNRRMESWIPSALGLSLRADDTETAVRLLQEAVASARDWGSPQNLAMHLGHLGSCLVDVGNFTEAVPVLTEALALNEMLGEYVGVAENILAIADALVAQGEIEEAEVRYEEALRLFQEYGHFFGIGRVLYHLARLFHRQGNVPHAHALLDESLAWFVKSQRRGSLIGALNLVASFCLEEGHYERGVRLAAAIHTSSSPGDASDEHALAPARAALGDERFAAAWAAGAALTLDEAIQAARAELRQP